MSCSATPPVTSRKPPVSSDARPHSLSGRGGGGVVFIVDSSAPWGVHGADQVRPFVHENVAHAAGVVVGVVVRDQPCSACVVCLEDAAAGEHAFGLGDAPHA